MPNCFTLTKKGEEKPTDLTVIDAELCALVEAPVHPKFWVYGWYNSIGLGLALGASWDKMRESFKRDIPNPEDEELVALLKFIDYLEKNYTTSAWYQAR